MDRQKLAKMIDGREYTDEITPDIYHAMKGTDLVVVFGASDDLMEFRGAIDDEVGAYDGGTAYLSRNGLLENRCDDDECPYFRGLQSKAATVEALWCPESDISWTYETDIPHSTFTIMEDGEKYCRGIVFHLSGVK